MTQTVHSKLGRVHRHDERSRGFAMGITIDRATWRDRSVRIYDPYPNPNQPVGCCTMCAKAMQLNAVGNRQTGRVLNLEWALNGYRLVTTIDPFEGSWEPDDTGSSSLASCQAAQRMGVGGEYRWLFGGADEVVQNIVEGKAVSVGTRWDWNMFEPDADRVISPGGGEAGGHQYIARRYWFDRDLVGIRCWWGADYRDVWIARTDLDSLLRDNGDAHFQQSVNL